MAFEYYMEGLRVDIFRDESASLVSLLKSYGISARGFLPGSEPSPRLLDPEFGPWEALAAMLPDLVRTHRLRDAIQRLPVLSIEHLMSSAQLERAMLLLCVFLHAYVWSDAPASCSVPKSIAVPLHDVAARLDRLPILQHSSIVLNNWRLKDPTAGFQAANLEMIQPFLGSSDENWFFMLTAEMECAGAPLIPLCWKLQDTASQLFGFLRSGRMPPAAGSGAPAGDARCLRASSLGSGDSHADGTQLSNPTAASSESLPLAMSPSVSSRTSSTPGRSRLVAPGGWLTQVGDATVVLLRQLQAVAEHVDILTRLILTMTRGCSPDAFYNEIRPFLAGWKNNPTLRAGLLYEGVSDQPLQLYGGSAAQSSLVPLLDIAFGVQHSHVSSSQFLRDMRAYMPKGHRRFLQVLEAKAMLRQTITSLQQAVPIAHPAAGSTSAPPSEPLASDSASANPSNSASERPSTPPLVPSGVTADRVTDDVQIPYRPHLFIPPEAQERIPDVLQAFDRCLLAIANFRGAHMKIVQNFIIKPQRQAELGATVQERAQAAGGRGTGGTPLMDFLRPLRQETYDARVHHSAVADRATATP